MAGDGAPGEGAEARAAERGLARRAIDEAGALLRDADNRRIFVGAYLISVLAFSYLFAGTIYNNHDFPDAFYRAYPSYTTWQEGRFIGDILYQAQGGSALPVFHMALSVAVQAFNGLLAAYCLGITRFWAKACIAIMACIHPAIADYYSWAGVALHFCLGDTFAIAAVIAAQRRGIVAALIGSVFVVLSVATYQQKVSAIATFMCLALMVRVLEEPARAEQPAPSVWRMAARFAGICAGGLALYVPLLRWTVTNAAGGGHRLYVNSFGEILAQSERVVGFVRQYFFTTQNFLHPNDYCLTAAAFVLFACSAGAAVIKAEAPRLDRLRRGALLIVLIAALPLAMNAVFLVTSKAYATDGRFFGTYAYVLAFLLAYAIERPPLRRVAGVVFACLAVFFTFDAAQYSYRAYMQNRFEYSFVTRIAARIEPELQPWAKYKLVILGDLPWKQTQKRMSRKGNIAERQVIANYDQPGFIHYRRVEYLNFLLGTDFFTFASEDEMAKGRAYAKGAHVWPARDSVALLGDVLVVVLPGWL